MDYLKSAYSRLSTLNYSHLLVLGLVVKAIVSDVSYATFLLTVPVLGYESYKLYLKSKKVDPVAINHEVMDRLDKLQAKVNASTLERSVTPSPQATKRYF